MCLILSDCHNFRCFTGFLCQFYSVTMSLFLSDCYLWLKDCYCLTLGDCVPVIVWMSLFECVTYCVTGNVRLLSCEYFCVNVWKWGCYLVAVTVWLYYCYYYCLTMWILALCDFYCVSMTVWLWLCVCDCVTGNVCLWMCGCDCVAVTLWLWLYGCDCVFYLCMLLPPTRTHLLQLTASQLVQWHHQSTITKLKWIKL